MKIKQTAIFWALLLLLLLARLFYIGWSPLDLVPDEAQYWDWSRHLDISYYSKGPFIAYNIFFGTKLGEMIGSNPPNPAFWVRFFAVVNSTVLAIIAWLLSIRIWKDKSAALSAILTLTAIPIYVIGSILMTIDNPLMLFWALYIYFVLLALEKEKNIYWYLSGIVLGFGFLSKYTMIILIPCVILYLAFTQKHRYWLKRKEFYFGILIGLLFFLPVLYWNMKHDWIGMRHVIGQAGLAKNDLGRNFFTTDIFEFISIQFAVVSPVIFILIIWGFIKAWRLRSDYRYGFLFWFGAPLGILYFILSLHEYCQPNWTAPMYFTGAIIAGNLFNGKKILKIGIGIGVFTWLLVFSTISIQFLPETLDPAIRLKGWKILGAEVGKIETEFAKEGPFFIFSDKYQTTSELAFYIPGHPKTYCVNLGRRMNQYDIWQDFSKLKNQNGIYVKHRDQDIDPEIKDAFMSYEKLPIIDIKQNDKLIHEYTVFLCRGFKGFEKAANEISY